ncbi:MAG: hypothetical protein ABSG43_05875 [Solirubrobacteraceae bacterium]
MGRRNRQRDKLAAAPAEYRDEDGSLLMLRGSLSPASRRDYAAVLAGGQHREDAWQRGVEFLFERLAVSWSIAGVPIERQKELLGRYRIASERERRFVRDCLRAHLHEHFPELQAP